MRLTEQTNAIAKKDPESKLSVTQLQGALPSNLKKYVTQEMVDVINDVEDGDFREHYRNNVLSFSSVLREGKYKTLDYINAVKFVSYKLLGDSNTLAYSKTFPERYQRLVDKGITGKNIASYSTAYNRGELVNKIMEQTLIPVHILNMDLHQEAINTQAELMRTARSETVRQKAAECLIAQGSSPSSMINMWLQQWPNLWPKYSGRFSHAIEELLNLIQGDYKRFKTLPCGEAWKARLELQNRLRLIFRQYQLQPATALSYIALLSLQLERLRAELLHRLLFPDKRLML